MTDKADAPDGRAAKPQTAGGLSGLDALKLSLRPGAPRSPISDLIDFKGVSFEEGVATFEGTPGRQHYNPIGIVHGGFAATLLDAAMWSAVHSSLPAGSVSTTLELKVNYLRALTDKSGPVTCEGRLVHKGSRTAVAEARLTDGAGRLCAHATSTLLITASA